MMQAQDQATKIINQNAGEAPSPQFTVGDQVWLEGSHLKLPHQSTKLAPKRYGPFMITKQINPVTYQLILPATWQIHPVFHVSLLSPYVETDAHGPKLFQTTTRPHRGRRVLRSGADTWPQTSWMLQNVAISHQMERKPRK